MSSTPTNQNSKPSTPPKTTGWSAALFGTGWLSGKKSRNVDSSTGSTASKSKTRPSPKPFQNLEGFNSVPSPEQGTSNTPSTNMNGSAVSTPNAQLQQVQKTQTLPSKSPWKASPNAKFSAGNLKPDHPGGRGRNYRRSSGANLVPSEQRFHRNNFKILGAQRSVRRTQRGNKNLIRDYAHLGEVAAVVRPAIEGTSQSTELNNNYRNFAYRKAKPGKRLHATDRNTRLNGRLPIQAANADTKFVANGKRSLDSNVEDKETYQEPSVTKKRRVNFAGTESVSINQPIENIMATPAKDTGSLKRKATPYKPAAQPDAEMSETSKTPISDRKILKAKRSPEKKKAPKTSEETPEYFPPMPKVEAVSYPFTNWKKPEEGEDSKSIKSTRVLDSNFMRNFLPKDPPIVLPAASAQFDQGPLFLGPKQDRSVLDQEEGSVDGNDVGGDQKRAKTEDTGGGEIVEMSEDWGNVFAHLYEGKVRCPNCSSWVFDLPKCESCNHDLSPPADTKEPSKPPAPAGSIGQMGFSLGATSSASEGQTSSNGFPFGAPAAASASTAAASSSSATGGFKFGASSAAATSGASVSGGFTFGATSSTTTTTATSGTATASTVPFQFGTASAATTSSTSGGFPFAATTSDAKTTAPTASSDAPQAFSFGSTSKETASSETKSLLGDSGKSGLFASGPSPAPADPFSKKDSEKSLPATSTGFGLFGAPSTSESSPAPAPSVTGFGSSSSTAKDSDSKKEKPTISFGGKPATEPTTAAPSTSGFSFSGATSSAPSASSSAPAFSFGASSASTSTAAPPLGSIPSEEKDDGSSRKKRRSRDDANDASSSQPAVTFGSQASTEAPAAATPAPAPFKFGATSAPTPAPATAAPTPAAPAFNFGSTPAAAAPAAPTFGATPAPAPAATPAAPAFKFGSTSAAPTPAAAPAFGATPAPVPTPAAPFSFGSSTPAAPTPAAAPFTFGATSAPAPTPAAPFSFGSSTPAPAAPAFGSSTPAPAAPAFGSSTPAPAAPTFGSSTPAPAFGATAPAPSAPMAFGSTPAAAPGGFGSAPAPSTGMNFGSTTPAQGAPFGSTTPAAAPGGFGAPAAPFGSTTPAAPFGSTQAPAAPQPFGNTSFGSSQPAAPSMGGFGAPAPNAGFNLGTGGGPSSGRTPGRNRRRIVRAKRPGQR